MSRPVSSKDPDRSGCKFDMTQRIPRCSHERLCRWRAARPTAASCALQECVGRGDVSSCGCLRGVTHIRLTEAKADASG